MTARGTGGIDDLRRRRRPGAIPSLLLEQVVEMFGWRSPCVVPDGNALSPPCRGAASSGFRRHASTERALRAAVQQAATEGRAICSKSGSRLLGHRATSEHLHAADRTTSSRTRSAAGLCRDVDGTGSGAGRASSRRRPASLRPWPYEPGPRDCPRTTPEPPRPKAGAGRRAPRRGRGRRRRASARCRRSGSGRSRSRARSAARRRRPRTARSSPGRIRSSGSSVTCTAGSSERARGSSGAAASTTLPVSASP